MKLTECYLEEDLFPKIFADYEERPYGILFYSTNNKDSYVKALMRLFKQ